jgi:hypothetical protein
LTQGIKVEDEIEKKSKAERRQQKKDKRKFSLHGSSHRVIYRNAIMRRLREKK